MRVLLVDDSKVMRSIQRRALESMGGVVETTEAGDGLEALTAIASNPAGFDLMLVDWNMPNMDGRTLLGKVREKDRRTPIIMVTTEAEKQRVLDAVQAGANNYVIKPFTTEALVERVKQTLAKRAVAAAAA